jgi:hypothetical protein
MNKFALALAAVAATATSAHATGSKTLAVWSQGVMKAGHVAHDQYAMNVAFFVVPDAHGDASPITSTYKDNKCNFILRLNNDNRFLGALMDGFFGAEDQGTVAYAASLHELGHCITGKLELAAKDDKNNELAQDIFALAYIAQNNPEQLDKAVRVFDHMRNDFQEVGSHGFGYDYKAAARKISAMPKDMSPMQISRAIVYNTVVAVK